ncbi:MULTISPECIES: hypothetical protein [unclassified Ruegeria]|uniref:hypothetical protein n=1 Tax=unclassified Ruegeria TaxID=2625375 RepID=UPI001487622F|nr:MULTISPECIES: hypothetical protein [unclassified Ruegeria]
MFKEDNSASAVAFARDFLDRYTAVGFGALSKREVDLLLIQLLQKHLSGFHAKSDFDAALMLRTTKRKIRGLRDEVSFREARSEDYLNSSLRAELKRAEVLPSDHGMVKIQLDDAVLRGYAEKLVRSEFGIVDGSFNSAILQLSGEKYLLLCLSVLSAEEREQAQQALAEIQPPEPQAGEQGKTLFTQFKEAFVAGAGQQAGKLCVSGAMALATGGASVILETTEPLKDAGRSIGQALQQSWNYFTQDQDGGE